MSQTVSLSLSRTHSDIVNKGGRSRDVLKLINFNPNLVVKIHIFSPINLVNILNLISLFNNETVRFGAAVRPEQHTSRAEEAQYFL